MSFVAVPVLYVMPGSCWVPVAEIFCSTDGKLLTGRQTGMAFLRQSGCLATLEMTASIHADPGLGSMASIGFFIFLMLHEYRS